MRGPFEQGQQVWIVDRDDQKSERLSKTFLNRPSIARYAVDSCRLTVGAVRCADRTPQRGVPTTTTLLHAGLLSAPLFTVIKLWPPLPIT